VKHDTAQSLWHRVLVQAVRDAVASPNVVRKNDRLAIGHAQSWLESGGNDFATVCTLAGRDPDQTREWWLSIKDDPAKITAVRLNMRDTGNDTSSAGKQLPSDQR